MRAEGDITIIGGSVAGCIAALLLARNGLGVSLIESKGETGSKACGEGLSLIGKRYLHALGLWDGQLERSSRPFFGFKISFLEGRQFELRSSNPVGYSVRRSSLNGALFATAVANPKVTLINDRVVGLTHHGALQTIWLKRHSPLHVAKTLVAGGVSSRRLLGGDQSANDSKRRFGVILRCTGRWATAVPDLVLIESVPGLQLLITPISATDVNVTILTSGNRRETLAELTERGVRFCDKSGFEVESINERLGANRVGASCGPSGSPGLYATGDAAEVLDPIGGMGMTHAIVSASLAATHIATIGVDPRLSWRNYLRQREAAALPLRMMTNASFFLNVKRDPLARLALRACPRLGVETMGFLERRYPINATNKERVC